MHGRDGLLIIQGFSSESASKLIFLLETPNNSSRICGLEKTYRSSLFPQELEVQTYLSKVVQACLPILTLLKRRSLIQSDIYSRFHEEETLIHILFKCRLIFLAVVCYQAPH